MKSWLAWMAGNGVAANLLMIGILVIGIASSCSVKREVFPEMQLDVITVTVPYPGGTPEEIEDSICKPIEREIESIEGIDRIVSTAAENNGLVTIELESDADASKVLDDVKTRIDAITSFPEDAERPIVADVVIRNLVLNVAVGGKAGSTPERSLKEIAERVRDDLSRLDGISLVEVASARPYEISIEVSEDALRQHGLKFADVERAVRGSSLDLPAGSIDTASREIVLRTVGKARRGAEFAKIPLITYEDGSRVVLGQVAKVVDGFADTDQAARFNNDPAVMVRVFRVGNENALEIADIVHEWVRLNQQNMPEGVTLTIWKDGSKVLQSRLDTLTNNGISGLLLVLLVLALFLQVKLAIWVAIGIFVSLVGTFTFMPMWDVSVNVISLFAFILVLGILVDDAIVVGESIYSARKTEKTGLDASIRGVNMVSVPVVFGVLTTVAAFLPAMFVPGAGGRIWLNLPVVVIGALIFSLIESLFVLPAHLAHGKTETEEKKIKRGRGFALMLRQLGAPWAKFQGGIARGMELFIEKIYQPVVRFCVNWRYLTMAGGVAILLLSVGFVGGGFVRFIYFPAVEADDVAAMVTMPQGTPLEITKSAVDRLERAAEDVRDELRTRYGHDIVVNKLTLIGEFPMRNMRDRGSSGGNIGAVEIELLPAEERPISGEQVVALWREKLGEIPGVEDLTFSASLASTAPPIDIQLSGPDLVELEAVATKIRAKLETFEGVFDVSDSFQAGKEELRLTIKPEAEALGLTMADLATQVRAGFYGAEVQRIQRVREEVKVMVRYPEDQRDSIGNLENMRIRTPDGREVPFLSVAEVERTQGFAAIKRVDSDRAINVTGDVDVSKANANQVLRKMMAEHVPAILAQHPNVRASLEGQSREQAETLGALQIGMLLALIGIYALLAIPLKSYLQPFLIMISIPFGIIGAIGGHYLMGLDLSILSVIGIVALAGVVVNASLVLIDFINQHREESATAAEAVVKGAVARFRPIFLTSVTTFAGLTPIMMEKSLQAQFLIPMAVSLAFGVLFSTVITLIGVPAAYMALEDLKWLFRETLRGYGFHFEGDPEPTAEPALATTHGWGAAPASSHVPPPPPDEVPVLLEEESDEVVEDAEPVSPPAPGASDDTPAKGSERPTDLIETGSHKRP